MSGPPTATEVLALEEHMATTWVPLESQWLGRWLLRAAGGWTGRANSVLALGDPGVDLDAALDTVGAWYRQRDLRPMVAVPLPAQHTLEAALHERGWRRQWGAEVMTAPVPAVLAAVPERFDVPAVEFAAEPDAAWVAAYHYRGGPLPSHAMAVMRHRDARYASVRAGGEVLAIGRFVVCDGMVGVTAMEVAASQRRRGLGAHLLRGAMADAAARGAGTAWLQVDHDNAGGKALYRSAGFTRHHEYFYDAPEEGTAA